MHNPEKSVPQALRISMALVGIIYLLFIGSILLGIPQTVFHSQDTITIPQALTAIFPDQYFLIQTIGISIIFSIMGTIHAVIWAASEFLLSYFKFMHCPWIQQQIAQRKITQKTTVLLASSIIVISFLTIKKISIFFSITAACMLFAFIASISSRCLFLRQEWKSGQNYITIVGLISALVIFAIALQDLMVSLMAWLK